MQSDRYAKYYKEDGVDKRTLYKVFGIRFDILVNGKVRVARRWVRPRIPGVAVPCPQEGVVGTGEPVRVSSSGADPSQQLLGSAGEGNTEGKPVLQVTSISCSSLSGFVPENIMMG